MANARKLLVQWLKDGHLQGEDISTGLVAAGVYPAADQWKHFLQGLLLYLGVLALGFSAIFFVAYNWDDIGRYAKFGLLQLLMCLAVAGYFIFYQRRIFQQISLLLAALFLGALLALYGQTYQTGADPWQLFFNWALLLLPWVLVARFPVLWMLCILLFNLSAILYFETFGDLFGGLFGVFINDDLVLLWALFVFNLMVMAIWEVCSLRLKWMRELWVIRLLATMVGYTITWLCLRDIFTPEVEIWSSSIWAIWMACMFYMYRYRRPDLFILSGLCLTAVIVVTSFLGRLMSEDLLWRDTSGIFLFLAFIVVIQGTGAAVWLKHVNRELQQ